MLSEKPPSRPFVPATGPWPASRRRGEAQDRRSSRAFPRASPHLWGVPRGAHRRLRLPRFHSGAMPIECPRATSGSAAVFSTESLPRSLPLASPFSTHTRDGSPDGGKRPLALPDPTRSILHPSSMRRPGSCDTWHACWRSIQGLWRSS